MRKRRYDIWLNGQSLSSISDAIQIEDVQEVPATVKVNTASNAKYDGLRFIDRERQSLSVNIPFVVWERNEMLRAAIMDDILAWVSDGDLEVNYRHNQRLRVRFTSMPSVSSSMRWTETIVLTFTAYGHPFWESLSPLVIDADIAANTPFTASISPNGTAGTSFLSFRVTNLSDGLLSSLSVTAGKTKFSFANLWLSPGKTLIVDYTTDGLLEMLVDGVSVMDKRTSASDDDLILYQRKANAIAVQADQPAAIKLMARGRYL